MTDTPESLQSALDDLTRRVAAFEKAQVEEEEPPALDDTTLHNWLSRPDGAAAGTAAREILYLRRELARLREGLKVQPGDAPAEAIEDWAAQESATWLSGFAREIQRHRALLKDGGGK